MMYPIMQMFWEGDLFQLSKILVPVEESTKCDLSFKYTNIQLDILLFMRFLQLDSNLQDCLLAFLQYLDFEFSLPISHRHTSDVQKYLIEIFSLRLAKSSTQIKTKFSSLQSLFIDYPKKGTIGLERSENILLKHWNESLNI